LPRGVSVATMVAVEERDLQTLMQALFDIKTDVKTILELLLDEEDDGEEEETDDA
jgi:hypothetical protein